MAAKKDSTYYKAKPGQVFDATHPDGEHVTVEFDEDGEATAKGFRERWLLEQVWGLKPHERKGA